MKTNIAIDLEKNTVIVSNTFYKKASLYGTPEYCEKQLKVFEAVKRIAEMKGSKYPLTKKWFLNAYPEYKENEVKENETAKLAADSDEEIEAMANAQLALVG